MNEQEIKLEKVKKSCRIAKNVTRVFLIILLVAVGIMIFASLACVGYKDEINKGATQEYGYDFEADFSEASRALEMSSGLLTVRFDTQTDLESGNIAGAVVKVLACAACLCLVMGIVFGLLFSIFKTLENGESPFSAQILKKLKTMFIVITVIMGLFMGVGLSMISGLVLWCIYCILDYGCVLQRDVDETL